MPAETSALIDLLDLKMLPAWVKEPAVTNSEHRGEEDARLRRGERAPRTRRNRMREAGPQRGRADFRQDRQRPLRQRRERNRTEQPAPPSMVVRFLPEPRACENVGAQIKADALAYSLFSLAHLFLQKPERYDVHLQTRSESPLFQLGKNGPISVDRQFLENNAFRFVQKDFYKIDITQTEPIKGNFTSVARDPLSGTLLGPTNHHSYQPRLRSLYEQRFSRRMTFADYQRQIEIVGDPVLVERWKEEARTVTTYTSIREEPPLTFSSAAEAERHFRTTYLPGLVRTIEETTIDGLTSRQTPDRILRRVIENAWAAQNRLPSQVMQELAARFREAGLHIFRHRRGMLFVSPIRVHAFAHEQTGVSPQVQAILQTIAEHLRMNRKDLADKLIVDLASEDAESRKLALAADLHWLIDEGYVIEFNDGSLDLPRSKPKTVEAAASTAQTHTTANTEPEFVGAAGIPTGNAEL